MASIGSENPPPTTSTCLAAAKEAKRSGYSGWLISSHSASGPLVCNAIRIAGCRCSKSRKGRYSVIYR